jgi:hypothetical protein
MTVALQMLIVLGLPAGVVIAALWFRHQERLRVLQVVEASAAKDHPLSPEMINALPGAKSRPANADLRRGVLMLALGVAIVLVGICALVGVATTAGEGAVAIGVGIAAVGAIPLCLGAALIFLSHSDRNAVGL